MYSNNPKDVRKEQQKKMSEEQKTGRQTKINNKMVDQNPTYWS